MDIINTLNIPKDVACGFAVITCVGQKQMVIQNFKKIVEYDDSFVRIKTKKTLIDITGTHLCIERYDNYEIEITGVIKEIKYV